MSKEIKYKPYFYLNGVGILYKTYSEEHNIMYFFSEDLKLQASFHDCERNYGWQKCAKLFGDAKK